MDPLNEALRLLKRQAQLQQALRRSNPNRMLDERELFLIRRQLTRYPAAVQAITLAAAELHCPIELVRASDVEARSRRSRQLQA